MEARCAASPHYQAVALREEVELQEGELAKFRWQHPRLVVCVGEKAVRARIS